MSSPTRHPLAWPDGWPRTKIKKSGIYSVPIEKAIRELDAEITRFGGKYPLLSSNVPLTMDGRMRFDREPQDSGVAVYFELRGKQRVFACDTFYRIKDNVRAIGKTIEALRAIERNGASALLDRSLAAFEALPAKHWAVLGIEPTRDPAIIQAAYKVLAMKIHPDRGGTVQQMAELNAARDDALRSLTE